MNWPFGGDARVIARRASLQPIAAERNAAIEAREEEEARAREAREARTENIVRAYVAAHVPEYARAAADPDVKLAALAAHMREHALSVLEAGRPARQRTSCPSRLPPAARIAPATRATQESPGRAWGAVTASPSNAAALLGVSPRQLARWLAEDDLADVPRVPRGYHGHRPLTATCDRCGATPCTCAPIPREWPPWCERCGQPHLDDCS
jgi:hypothetical protein